MSGFSQLLEMGSRSNCNRIPASPAVRAAYQQLMDDDCSGAMQRFQRVLKDTPRDHEALAGLAICLADSSGRYVSATKLARESVRLAPKAASGYIALGYIHLLGSRITQGYRYLMKARKLAPSDPRLMAGLSRYEDQREPVVVDLAPENPINQALGYIRGLLRTPFRRVMAATLAFEGCYLVGMMIR